jgi:hypothetical protein
VVRLLRLRLGLSVWSGSGKTARATVERGAVCWGKEAVGWRVVPLVGWMPLTASLLCDLKWSLGDGPTTYYVLVVLLQL